jgi:hypothetical protein
MVSCCCGFPRPVGAEDFDTHPIEPTLIIADLRAATLAGHVAALKGAKALTKDEKGLWSIPVGPLEPAIYSYGFAVDGAIGIPTRPIPPWRSAAGVIRAVSCRATRMHRRATGP